MIYLPGCILFVYFHSLIKLWALFTFGDIAWGSRLLNDEEQGLLEGAIGSSGGDAARNNDGEEGLAGFVIDMGGDINPNNTTKEGLSDAVVIDNVVEINGDDATTKIDAREGLPKV